MVRLFFATDVHGSEKCFLKFLNSWKYYPVQILVMGGDITGKGLVPIWQDHKGHFHATLTGEEYDLTLENEVQSLEKNIRFNGFYPYRTSQDELDFLEKDEDQRKVLFKELILRELARWEQLAEDRLRGSGIDCYIIPGNDDIRDIDSVLNQGKVVINVDGKVVEIAEGWVMLNAGYSNHTPWNGPREYDEQEISQRIEQMILQTPENANLIFNFHCPPYNSGIDTVQLVDKNFRPRFQGFQPYLGPAGSKAVRESIDRYRPKLCLHGHIHEGKGLYKHKDTLAINPGSEYTSGILKGVIVSLSKKKVESHMFTDA